MGAFASEPLTAGSLLPFLHEGFIENRPVASCENHDHLALIYENQEEQFDIVVPFLQLGMERGEKGVFIVDDTSPERVRAAMEHYGIDVDAANSSGALAIITQHDAYLKNGDFDPDWMISFLAEAVVDAKNAGFHAVRASGEMTWALGPGGDANGRLIEYECKLNTFFPGHDMGGICQYNRRRFRPETLMQVIHTHPRLVFRGEVCENPYYIPANIFQGVSADGRGDPVRRLLESMADNTRLRRQLSAETEALRRSEKLIAAGRMAATMAHEINNPLEAMVNLWYLLNQENLSPQGRAHIEMMGKEIDRISHIAKQTIEFYTVGARPGHVDLARVVDEATQLSSPQADSQGTAVEVQHRATTGICGFDSELRQLFVKLIVNALEAGASKVRIRTSVGSDWKKPSRRGMRVVIADNGPGIAPTVAAKAFEPFFTTKEEKGTGLGLWVSKGIVQKHEGSMSMRTSTRLGRSGTAFSIFLPAA